jgi:hypothetical protein
MNALVNLHPVQNAHFAVECGTLPSSRPLAYFMYDVP